MIAQNRKSRAAGKRGYAADKLVQHDSQRVQVRGRRRLLAVDEFRGDVLRRTQKHGASPAWAFLLDILGDAEIRKTWSSGIRCGIDQDVLGLNVPVDDTSGMDRGQARGDASTEFGHVCGWQRPRTRQHRAQVTAVDKVHDDGDRVTLDD